MDKQTHEKFTSLLEGISQSQSLRNKFLTDPLLEIRQKLGSTDTLTNEHIGLANEMLISVLSNPAVIEDIVDLHRKHKAGEISADEKTLATAQSFFAAAPIAIQNRIQQTWGGGELTRENFKIPGPAAIANLWVAANETAVVNHFIIHSTEYVTSGAQILKKNELRNLANEIFKDT